MVVVDGPGLYPLHLIIIDVGTYQSRTVGSYPDVAVTVACHTVYAMVDTNARQSQLIADSGVPRVGTLVINHQRALTI